MSAFFLPILFLAGGVQAQEWYRIEVIDGTSGAPVPDVRLETVHDIVLQADDNGLVAFYEPGLMNLSLWFGVEREGYTAPSIWGFAGRALSVTEGGTGTISLTRDGAEAVALGVDEHTRLLDEPVPGAADRFAVQVIDSETGRGVPLIQLATEHGTFWTDSAGWVAYYAIDHMDTLVRFTVSGHGYSHSEGSVTFSTTPGESALIELDRDNLAERLYRVTGAGIYTDTVLLDLEPPTDEPLLDGRVMGQDTVFTVPYQGRIFWIWGDTSKPSFPLGNFYVSAATSAMPGDGGLDPSDGVDLEYFTDTTGFAKQMAPSTTVPGDGVCWLGELTVIADESGEEHLFAGFTKVLSDFTVTKSGIVEFDDETEQFVEAVAYLDTDRVRPRGQSYRPPRADGDYVHFGMDVRVPDSVEGIRTPTLFEAYTPLTAGTGDTVVRDASGGLVYAWTANTPPLDDSHVERALVTPEEVIFGHIREPSTDQAPLIHTNHSLAPNDHRRRYLRIMLENWGTPSFLGEIWFAEGDTPMGPFVYARKLITHDHYSFYNPRYHPFFDQEGGRIIYFEGTYTHWLTSAEATPRYNYNQMMYRLDLDAPGAVLPVPVYETSLVLPGQLVTKDGLRPDTPAATVAFMAPDRPGDLTAMAVAWSGPSCTDRRLVFDTDTVASPLFYALASDTDPLPPQAQPLRVFENAETGEVAVTVDADWRREGFVQATTPLAWVWKYPMAIDLPVLDHIWPLIADAGADQCVEEDRAGAGATLGLDASASSFSRGEITDYTWAFDGGSASGVAVDIVLAVGTHRIDLTITGDDGGTATDTLLVAVTAGPEAPDTASPDTGGDTGPEGTTDTAIPDPETEDTGVSATPRTTTDKEGCGCASGPVGAGPWVLVLLAACRRRRYGPGCPPTRVGGQDGTEVARFADDRRADL